MSKTIIVTGSTDGIGKLTALNFAKKGHTVYIHGRSKSKVDAVMLEIQTTTNNHNIHGLVADFSDLEAVSRLAEQIIKDVPKIDVLINNAGVFKSATAVNHLGIDLRLVVNYLAPYVLTNTLLPLLKKGTQTRIINLSSAAQTTVSLKALKGTKELLVNEAYAQSKLALTMWSFYLAKKEPKLNIIAVNPGSLLNTKMANEAYGQHWSPASKGSDILYELACSENYQNSTGTYYDNDNGGFNNAHPDAYNKFKIKELMETTEELRSINSLW